MSPVEMAELPKALQEKLLRQIDEREGTAEQNEPLVISGSYAEQDIMYRSPAAREERARLFAMRSETFIKGNISLLIQIRQDFFDKNPDELIWGFKTFTEYCDNVVDISMRQVRRLIQGHNPASAKHDGSANRAVKVEPTESDWEYEPQLDSIAATKLYHTMLNCPDWQNHRIDGLIAKALHFGLSYVSKGSGARDGEIPEIPPYLQTLADEISHRIEMPINYIQCHNYGPDDAVTPHRDPAGMIVPMLTIGQERTFRVGGKVLGKDGKPFPPMASQASKKNGTHDFEKEILMRHGSLLIFNGGPTNHSMLPATEDKNFNPNGFDRRISILFRYTTPTMRKFGTRLTDEQKKQSRQEYEQAKREYRERIGWNGTTLTLAQTPATVAAVSDNSRVDVLVPMAEVPAATVPEPIAAVAPKFAEVPTSPLNHQQETAQRLQETCRNLGMNVEISPSKEPAKFHLTYRNLSEAELEQAIQEFEANQKETLCN